jgi:hypothetical protein
VSLSGGPASVLALQRMIGNAAVARVIPRYTEQLNRACCSSCASGHRCESEEDELVERAGARTLRRAVIARQGSVGQPPPAMTSLNAGSAAATSTRPGTRVLARRESRPYCKSCESPESYAQKLGISTSYIPADCRGEGNCQSWWPVGIDQPDGTTCWYRKSTCDCRSWWEKHAPGILGGLNESDPKAHITQIDLTCENEPPDEPDDPNAEPEKPSWKDMKIKGRGSRGGGSHSGGGHR